MRLSQNAIEFGSLEEHVLVEVSQALFAGSLVRRAHLCPDLKVDHRRQVSLAQQQREPVREHLMEDGGIGQCPAKVPVWRSHDSPTMPAGLAWSSASKRPDVAFARLTRGEASRGLAARFACGMLCRRAGARKLREAADSALVALCSG